MRFAALVLACLLPLTALAQPAANYQPIAAQQGIWDAEQRTMHWTALQPDGNGHSVNYRMTEAYDSPTKRTLSFFQVALQSGRLVKLAEMKFTRR